MLKEAWTLAIETLSWMEMQRLSEQPALARTIRQLNIREPNTVRLAYLLVCETVKRRNFIDKFINKAMQPHSIDECSFGVQSFMRLYVHQTRIAKKWSTPDIEEAENIVKMARSILDWKTLKEIEPFLGMLLTQKPAAVFEDAGDEEKNGLLTFHPTWFVRYCFDLFGRREALTMLEANMQAPPSYVRLNTLKADENVILEKLAQEGISLNRVESMKSVYEVKNAKTALTRTKSFKEGFFSIQDKASCLSVETTNPQPGMTLLDVCAAPGTKTTHYAQLMQNRGIVYSVDFSKHRMSMWRNETARMGIEIAEPVAADARKPLPLKEEVDIVVLDPPCTNTGAFASAPSSKWRSTRRSIDRMAEIQWEMLNNSGIYVKPRGTLVYSTSSVTVEENEMLIERFLRSNAQFSLTETSPRIGSPGLRGLENCQRFYPHIHRCNGYFIAKLFRNM